MIMDEHEATPESAPEPTAEQPPESEVSPESEAPPESEVIPEPVAPPASEAPPEPVAPSELEAPPESEAPPEPVAPPESEASPESEAPPPIFTWKNFLIGLAIGLVGGLIYAWLINPVAYQDVGPDRLNSDDRQAYILLVSEAYLQDGNLSRARTRLNLLGGDDPAELVAEQANQAFSDGADPEEVRALSVLAEALGGQPLAEEVFSGTLAPTSAPFEVTLEDTPGILPPQAITITPAAPTELPPTSPNTVDQETELDLIARTIICEDDYPAGQIEIYVVDSAGQGIPGIRTLIEWDDGQDIFFTGLKPEIDPGYADYDMEPNRIYRLTLVGLTEPVVGIESSTCGTPSGRAQLPTYRLEFAPGVPLEIESE